MTLHGIGTAAWVVMVALISLYALVGIGNAALWLWDRHQAKRVKRARRELAKARWLERVSRGDIHEIDEGFPWDQGVFDHRSRP